MYFPITNFPVGKKNSAILIYMPIKIIAAMQQFLSFYLYKMWIFQWVAKGLTSLPYNRDWSGKLLQKMGMIKKKQDMNYV